jgi:hypothetical protein
MTTEPRWRALPELALIACLVGLGGCGGDLDETDEFDEEESSDAVTASTARKGVDYAWGRPSPSKLHAAGYTFAARYLSYDRSGKNLTKSEAQKLRSHDLDVLVVWEWGADDVLDGHAKGVREAKDAEAEAKACGMPAGRPIYFAIDFDAQASQQSRINAYFDGVASVIGRARTGAYGGHKVIKRLFNAGKITYGWQTYAWSYGLWDKRAQLRQVKNDVHIDGVSVDVDRAIKADFGQWGFHNVSHIPQ